MCPGGLFCVFGAAVFGNGGFEGFGLAGEGEVVGGEVVAVASGEQGVVAHEGAGFSLQFGADLCGGLFGEFGVVEGEVFVHGARGEVEADALQGEVVFGEGEALVHSGDEENEGGDLAFLFLLGGALAAFDLGAAAGGDVDVDEGGFAADGVADGEAAGWVEGGELGMTAPGGFGQDLQGLDGGGAFGVGRQGEQLAVDGGINQDIAALHGGAADGDGAGFDGRVPVDAADELGQAGGLSGGLLGLGGKGQGGGG